MAMVFYAYGFFAIGFATTTTKTTTGDFRELNSKNFSTLFCVVNTLTLVWIVNSFKDESVSVKSSSSRASFKNNEYLMEMGLETQ